MLRGDGREQMGLRYLRARLDRSMRMTRMSLKTAVLPV
jgi:hypothetical protein